LFKDTATGRHYASATFTFLRVNDGGQTKFFTLMLKDAFITSYAFTDAQGNTTAGDVETVTLVGLQEIVIDPTSGVPSCFDTTTNAAC
jgi:type VI protein secretion system component Hcp